MLVLLVLFQYPALVYTFWRHGSSIPCGRRFLLVPYLSLIIIFYFAPLKRLQSNVICLSSQINYNCYIEDEVENTSVKLSEVMVMKTAFAAVYEHFEYEASILQATWTIIHPWKGLYKQIVIFKGTREESVQYIYSRKPNFRIKIIFCKFQNILKIFFEFFPSYIW